MFSQLIAYLDGHEGAGTWLAAIGTFAAVVTSLVLAGLSIAREGAERRIRERNRLSLTTSRFDAHGCLQVAIVYRAPGWESGWEARVKVMGPKNAYLMEGVRRPVHKGDRAWVEVNIGRHHQQKLLVATLDWHAADPDDALRASVFVTNGPGDNLAIGSAQLSISIYRVGGRVAATTFKTWVSPIGEHPHEARLAGKLI